MTTPISGTVLSSVGWDLLCSIHISPITCYEDIKGNVKIEIVVVLGGYGSLKIISNVAIRYSTYNFLIDFNRNYASIFYHFRVSVANYNLPDLHLAPPLEVTRFEFCQDHWQHKTRVPGLLCGAVCVILHLAISVEHPLVTDK